MEKYIDPHILLARNDAESKLEGTKHNNNADLVIAIGGFHQKFY